MIRQIGLDIAIQDFDLSPDASMFVAVSGKNLAIGSTRTEEQPLKMSIGNNTTDASFSPDWPTSSLLASANSDTVQIWRVDTGDCSTESVTYYDLSVAISPGSKYVAARSLEGYIDIRCGKSGECIRTLNSGNSCWGCPVFSPNLEFVACAEGNRADVWIWHLTTGETLHLLKSHRDNGWIQKMVFSDDSKYLVAGYDKNEARVWCVETGKCLFKSGEINGDDSNHDYRDYLNIVALAISPDTKYVARASEKWLGRGIHGVWGYEVRICDWRACHDISSFGPKQPNRNIKFCIGSLTFSSDATILAVICQVGEIRDERYMYEQVPMYEAQIWKVATGTFITCVAIGESFSEPFFDPITNKILTDRAGFCKLSSWEHWKEFSWRAYSLWQPSGERPWVCFGGEQIFLIPEGFCPSDELGEYEIMSSSLLAYTTSADEIMIIQLPNQHESQRLGIVALDSDNVGDSSLRADDASSKVVGYLPTGKSDPDEPKVKSLRLSHFLE
ncbi:uncharacterized protein Triagg1_549 [Trichoderma aggressivum f. europaeum]|uniref:Uncharacterized protein n=1 Tax=Trichoderma aggressivum f. europaeum TaxID=173218 RepID=A0AAE1INJ2_9HYPO|nr:hypothetical protein Triagg1_549 [Trichoderma aggressivum f. europaeum]